VPKDEIKVLRCITCLRSVLIGTKTNVNQASVQVNFSSCSSNCLYKIIYTFLAHTKTINEKYWLV